MGRAVIVDVSALDLRSIVERAKQNTPVQYAEEPDEGKVPNDPTQNH